MPLGAPANNWLVRAGPDRAPESGNKLDVLPLQHKSAGDKSAGERRSALKSAASRRSLREAGKLQTGALAGSKQSRQQSEGPDRHAPQPKGKLEHLSPDGVLALAESS